MKVWSFGDSWAEGAGLKPNEKRFGDYLAKFYNAQHLNKGQSGTSLGNILETFSKNAADIKKDDVVVIIIPPDIRWYDMENYQFNTLFIGMKEYRRFIANKNIYWFTYHHSVFIYTLIKICKDIDCKFILAHNYGNLEFQNCFQSLIETDYLLDSKKSLTQLLGSNEWKDNYSESLNHDGPPSIEGKYFIKNDNHPNQSGHKLISDLIIKKLEK